MREHGRDFSTSPAPTGEVAAPQSAAGEGRAGRGIAGNSPRLAALSPALLTQGDLSRAAGEVKSLWAFPRRFGALALLASLAACSGNLGDPFVRPGTWTPEAVNDHNLRVMVANPADLTAGRGSPLSSGQLAAIAVSRLRTDNVKPLPDSAVAEVVPVASGGSAQGGGAPPAVQGAAPQ